MEKRNILTRWLLPSLIASLGISLMLVFTPDIQELKEDRFSHIDSSTSFISSKISSSLEALSLYDFAPIFLPTDLNKKAISPSIQMADYIEDMNTYEDLSASDYTSFVLNKKYANLNRVNNIYYSSLKGAMPFYKMEDKKDTLARKNSISLSVIDVESGEKIISENLKLKDPSTLSKFFVPTEVFMSVSPNFSINIADNISSPSLDASTTELIRDAMNDAKIFQKIKSGYYKLIISP